MLHQRQGRHTEAEQMYQRALLVREQALGPFHPDVATTLENIGTLDKLQGRYAEAEPRFRSALIIRERALRPDHPAVGASLNNLAALYQSQPNRFREAEPLYQRALAISEAALGPNHPRVAEILCNWGAYLKDDGRIDEAAPHLLRALAISERVLGAEHPQTIRAAVQLADVYSRQGHIEEARKLFARANDKAVASGDLKAITIYFGTDRKLDGTKKYMTFGNEAGSKLLHGSTRVLVSDQKPTTSWWPKKKESESPSLSDMRRLTIETTATNQMELQPFVRSASERVESSRAYPGHALVFIHGFNTPFDSAVRRAAQLGLEMGFDGPVFAYAWPTREKTKGYLSDKDIVLVSRRHFQTFIEQVLTQTKAKRIHIIAHSMGNFLLSETLQRIQPDLLRKLNLGEIILASPDLDVDQFQETMGRLVAAGVKSTVYAASSDKALAASTAARGGKAQLGYIPDPKIGPPRIPTHTDVIDITAVDSGVFKLNHDLYANSPAIIEDLKRILKDSQRPPEARTQQMEKMTPSQGVYWKYRQ